MENLCEYSPRFRSHYDQCPGTLGLITGQAVVCGFTRSVWLCRNHAKRLQKQNQTSCCFKGETNCSNSSYFTPCPRRLTNVLSELPHYSRGIFPCKNHLDFLDQDPRVTNHELYKPPEKRKRKCDTHLRKVEFQDGTSQTADSCCQLAEAKKIIAKLQRENAELKALHSGQKSHDTPFHERFLNFHKQLTEHYDTGEAKLYNPDTMELFCDKHAPGLFNELQQVIRND